MDYNDIPLFVRVVETQSFTAAAEALGREKSSISRAVARLENDLGVRLLQRTTRKLALTDAGQEFFQRVRTSVAGVDEAANAARELGSEPRGVVRVTAPSDAHAFGLPEMIAEFLRRHPAIQIEMLLTTRQVDLVAEGIDIAIRAGKLMDSSLVARRVGEGALAMFAAPSYLKERGTPESLADLKKHDAILFRARGGHDTWLLTGPDGEESVEVHGKLSVDEMSFLMHATRGGAGIALIPALHARGPAQRGELQVVLPEYRVAGGTLHVVIPSSTFVPSRVSLLRDYLIEHLTRVMKAAEGECTRAHRELPQSKKKASAR